jgi:hypothetical protein
MVAPHFNSVESLGGFCANRRRIRANDIREAALLEGQKQPARGAADLEDPSSGRSQVRCYLLDDNLVAPQIVLRFGSS